MAYSDLLPIGSIVLLKEGEKRLMICGRVVCSDDGQSIHDYVGCYYPEGVIDSSQLFFFQHEDIEQLFFIGSQDIEEIEYRERVLSRLDEGEVAVRNGQIVLKEKE